MSANSKSLDTYLTSNWHLTVEAGNSALRARPALNRAKRHNRHYRARKQQLLDWAAKNFPNIARDLIEEAIDDMFPVPKGGYHYPLD